MKKKVLSLLLAVCLIVGMLPLAASAAGTEDVHTARLHDGLEYLTDDKLYEAGSYRVDATGGENGIVNVKISAKGLQAHAMGQEPRLMGYWCGFSVKAPDGAKQAKVINGTDLAEVQGYDMSTVTANGLQPDITADAGAGTINGIARWINVTDSSKKTIRYYKVQWCDAEGAALADSQDTIYAIDISGVETAAQNTVETATLDDQNTEELDPDLAETYELSSTKLVSSNEYGLYTDVAVNVQGLKEHKNGQNNVGYWAGIAVLPPEGMEKSVKGVKCAFARSFDELCAAELEADDYGPVNASEEKGLAAYANLGDQSPKTWLKVQWLDGSDNALSTTVYHIDFTGYTLAQPEENPAPEALTVDNANLEDHSEGGALVAQNQIATGFKTVQGAPVWDSTKNVWYFPITVTADTLKIHTNGDEKKTVGYWIGPAIQAPEGIEATDQIKVKTGASMADLDIASDAQASTVEEIHDGVYGVALYTNVTEANTDVVRWMRVQWIDVSEGNKVVRDDIFQITHNVATLETVGIKDIAVYESDAISDTVTAALGEDGKTITLSGVAPESETTYTLKYTTTAGGAGETKVTYDGSAFTPANFTVLNTEYTVVAAFADMPANVDVVAPAVPSVNAPEGTEKNLTDAAASVKVGAMSAAAVEAAQGLDPENAELKADAVAALKAKGVTVNDSDPIYYYVQPYLDIKVDNDSYVESADGKALTLDINPMYRVVVSTKNTFAGDLEQDQNAALLTGYEDTLTVTNAEVSVTLPTGFTAENSIYVKHHEHYHLATVAADKAAFTTESFSEFTFDTSAKPVASIGGTYYDSLQAAVDAVKDGGYIEILGSAQTATVNKVITFTTSEKVEINAGTGYEMVVTENGNGTFTYKFTNAGTSGGGTGGGGTGSTGYTVTVSATQNGTVTASPNSANKGDKVTLTVAPAEGYELGTLTAKDAKGNTVALTKVSDTEYTFVMPEGNVTVSATFVEKNATPFTDVKTADWWYEAVKYVYENKLMAGTSTTTFEPTAKLNRAQAVQILYNLEGQPTVTGTADFTDVSGHWALNAITWGAENNVVAGVGNGKFDPNADVTREQFAQMMYNYAKFKGYDLTAAGDLNSFSDVSKVSDWAVAALTWANGEGLINGNEDGTLAPNGTAIRGQAASILMNFDQNVVK